MRPWLALWVGLLMVPTLWVAASTNKLHQYVFFNMDHDKLDSPAFVQTAALEGARSITPGSSWNTKPADTT